MHEKTGLDRFPNVSMIYQASYPELITAKDQLPKITIRIMMMMMMIIVKSLLSFNWDTNTKTKNYSSIINYTLI